MPEHEQQRLPRVSRAYPQTCDWCSNMTNRLTAAVSKVQQSFSAQQLASTDANASGALVRELGSMCLAAPGHGLKGVTVFMDEDRLRICYRGDEIGNWRQADTLLVFENALGELF